MTDDFGKTITDAAQEPLSGSVDGQSVTNRPIDDLIKAHQYAESLKAAKRPGLGLRFGRIVPPGAV